MSPFDAAASPGERFSASYASPPLGRGRFDLPRDLSSTLYLAESADHAVAEMLQASRGRPLRAGQLRRAGLPLALVSVEASPSVIEGLTDLCDPDVLAGKRIRPDLTASRRRQNTQPVARSIWDAGGRGLRWWSAFDGDWHTVVLFTARVSDDLSYGEPEPLTVETRVVREAAARLGMRARGAG